MSTRVPGHALQCEGAPHVMSETGRVIRTYNSWGGIGGHGRGLCECGAMSDLLDSAHQRKAWHRQHKANVARESA